MLHTKQYMQLILKMLLKNYKKINKKSCVFQKLYIPLPLKSRNNNTLKLINYDYKDNYIWDEIAQGWFSLYLQRVNYY